MNSLILPCDVSKVSDGYHTFEELYEHRNLLFVNLVLCYYENGFKTRKNDKGEEIDGWFICGLNSFYGQITYHLPNKFWDVLNIVQEIPQNSNYDGYTSNDVLGRLFKLASKELCLI